ncbi:sensor histidine kinase [Sphaerisporangium rubeum]|uniref:Oxygen sensor histidine kinase NreB n=1 Tax=Sphaerisporangium rubeum TaxID=321317 RepID=A0A7X0M539_9ACTN|nr:sensor histidine kinase [Sphaerisporangium rubeum]MBB6472278.1 signal transduction histidine kinase [Sphaerisporangium rubeum]
MTETADDCARQADRRSAPADAWRAFHGWNILFVLAYVVTGTLVFLDDGTSVPARAAALVLLSVCAAAYVVFGRPALARDEGSDRARLLYVVFVLVTFVPATIVVPASSFAMFALGPQIFMTLSQPWAITMVLSINLAPAVRFVLEPGLTWQSAVTVAATSAVSVTFSIVFGPWMSRIIRQSAERAVLIEELEASRAQVARLSRERGAMAERERLAGEIHDTLAQGFTSIIMLIQAAEASRDPSRHLALAMRTARENLAEARGLIAALSPPPLDGSTLEQALRRIAARLLEELSLPVTFEVGDGSRPLPPGIEVVLVRAAQEALANVRRHAAASSVRVRLDYGESEVCLRVTDDGRGFDPAATPPGFGLRAMRARAEEAGGSVLVDGAPGKGTRLTVRIPYPEAAAVTREEAP